MPVFSEIRINEKLILGAVEELRARNLDYVFLIFHQPGPGVSEFDSSDWRDDFLKRLLDENNVPYIWSKDLVPPDIIAKRSFDKLIIPNDGHPTTYFNELIAEEIKRYVLADR